MLNGHTRNIYITHIHVFQDFGAGLESTSNIEGLWGYLKNLFKNMYYIIPSEYFISFERSRAYRNINSFINEKTMKKNVIF